MLAEECGLQADSLSRGNLITVAYQNGMHRMLNQHYNDLMNIAVKRWETGIDDATESARLIQIYLNNGVYGYDVHKIEPVLREAALKDNVSTSAKAANDENNLTAEERFRRFLYQEISYQESCLAMAEVTASDNDIESRQRQSYHRAEVAELRACLSMLNAGMTVQEIREQTQKTSTPTMEGPNVAAVIDLKERLKLNRAHGTISYDPISKAEPDQGPTQE